VVYVVTDTEIQITAVVYGGREPGYWRKRRWTLRRCARNSAWS